MADDPNINPQPSQEEGKQDVPYVENELDALKKKADEYLDGWKRAQADFINYKKDEMKRLEEFAKFSSESLMKEVLVVLDSLHLALASMEGNEAAKRGILIIKSQLYNILKSKGLEHIKVNVGEELFSPTVHEAVAQKESDKPHDTVLEVVEDGYALYGKIIRPARVIVAK